MINHRKQYAYLSVDQMQKTFTRTKTVKKSTMSEFFNIKLDLRKQKTNHEGPQSSEKMSRDKKITTVQPFFDKNSPQRPIEKVYVFAKSGKKRINTQKMLQNISKLIDKESASKKRNLSWMKKSNPNAKYEHSSLSPQQMTEEQAFSRLQIGEQGSREEFDRSKRQIFHKMLKRCEKLKQLYRFQSNLMNTQNLKQEGLNMRVNTEPLQMLFLDADIKGREQSPKKPLKKFFIKQNPQQKEDEGSSLMEDGKALEIRRYNNDSVLKNKLKNMIKRQRFESEQKRLNKFMTTEKWSNKIKYKKEAAQYTDEKEQVGPWNESNENFQFLLK